MSYTYASNNTGTKFNIYSCGKHLGILFSAYVSLAQSLGRCITLTVEFNDGKCQLIDTERQEIVGEGITLEFINHMIRVHDRFVKDTIATIVYDEGKIKKEMMKYYGIPA